MKKLFYITSDCWWDSDINVIPELSKFFDIEIIVLSDAVGSRNKFPKKTVPDNVKLHDFKVIRSNKDLRMLLFSLFFSVYLYIKVRNKLTFYVFNGAQYYEWFWGLFTPKSRKILSFHNYEEHTDCRWLIKKTQKMMLKRYKFFHFQSPSQELLFKKDYPTKMSFSTIMPPKDFGSPIITKRYFNNGLRTFLFFGFLRAYKHIEMFIKASNTFRNKANFIIAGNSKEWDKYKRLIDNDNNILCHIRFIANEEIPNYFCQSDFIVLPYEDSTQSGPLLIAYNYNIPAIVSDLPYFKQMVSDNLSGFVFEKGNQTDLDNCIKKAIDMTDAQYKNMKENLAVKVDNYKSKSDFAANLIKFLDNIL